MNWIANRTGLAAVLVALALGGLAAMAFWPGEAGQPQSDAQTPATQPIAMGQVNIEAGAQLYAENCAACHGAKLEGQPDWRTPLEDGALPAPPHDETGHTWHHGDPTLFNYVALGGKATLAAQGIAFNSGMPAFGDSLTDAEIRDILAYIRSHWSERAQKIQAARTEAELAAPDQ